MMKKNNPLISIVVPSRANGFELLDHFWSCLKNQTIQDFERIIVCDKVFSIEEWQSFQDHFKNEDKIRLISHYTNDFTPQSPGKASYVRNIGIQNARGEFIQLFDDDNEFDDDYLEKALAFYKQYSTKYHKEVVITPTLMWRNTDVIQNQGFSRYNYALARPQIHFLKEGKIYAEIRMFSGNGIFAKAGLLKSSPYDERIAWIAEDLDFVYSLWEKGSKILVFSDLRVRHQERDKTILEQAWIGNEGSAKQKIRNLFLWVKKHADWKQTFLFFLWSSWGICGWLIIKAFIYGGKDRWSIIRGLIQGYFSGWRQYFI